MLRSDTMVPRALARRSRRLLVRVGFRIIERLTIVFTITIGVWLLTPPG